MSGDIGVQGASERQMAFIEKLLGEQCLNWGQVQRPQTSYDASQLISQLIEKAKVAREKKGKPAGGGGRGFSRSQFKAPAREAISERPVVEVRLGMAMKECFRQWRQAGRDVWGEKRGAFIAEVLETYGLFSEIARQAGAVAGEQ